MNLSRTAALLGLLLIGLGLCMLLPLGVALFYGEKVWTAFLTGTVAGVLPGIILYWLFRDQNQRDLSHRDGIAIVGIAWTAAGLLGGLPFYLTPDFATFTDAFFESVSGFTTTGASVLTDVEKAGKAVLFWRSLTHWLGGMGFIVLGVAILPFLGVGGMQLYKAEVPSPTPDRLQPRITDTASVLWKVYALLTLLEVILLMLGGLDWFESVCHAFATMATGGFSTRNASVAGLGSAYLEWVVTLFMVLAGMNFTLHYNFLRRRGVMPWRDEECRWYLMVFAVCTLVIALSLFASAGHGIEASLRLAAFQVATIFTTTGFATADYALWPPICLGILVGLMFVGGSAGSTGGGPKVMRVLVILKQSWGELRRMVHPRLVAPVKVGGRTVERQVVSSIWAFMGIYMSTFLVVGLALCAMGLDPVASFSSSIACLGNIGPGLASVGPTGNYAHLPIAAKWLLSVAMIVGRLEIFTVLALLLPEFWRE